MSKRDWRILLEDIIDSISKIESYVQDLGLKNSQRGIS